MVSTLQYCQRLGGLYKLKSRSGPPQQQRRHRRRRPMIFRQKCSCCFLNPPFEVRYSCVTFKSSISWSVTLVTTPTSSCILRGNPRAKGADPISRFFRATRSCHRVMPLCVWRRGRRANDDIAFRPPEEMKWIYDTPPALYEIGCQGAKNKGE